MEFKDTGLPGHPLVEKAFTVARERHGAQRRGTTSGGAIDYISHPVLAAQILQQTIPDCPPALLAAGLTHDLIEDTGMTEEELGALLGPEVAALVKSVSFDPALKGAARVEFQQNALSGESLNSRRLKVADRLANLLSLSFDPSGHWTVVNKYDYWAASKTLIATVDLPDEAMRETAAQILKLSERAVFLAVKDRVAEKGLGNRHWKNMSPGLEDMRARAVAEIESDKNLYDDQGRPRQKASGFDDLYSHAAIAYGEIADVVNNLQIFSGFEAVVPEELKKQGRAEDVVKTRYGGDHRGIKDVARVAVVCENMDQVAYAIHNISRACNVIEIYDRFHQPPMSAYRDAALVVCSGGGHFCEVQIHLRKLWEAKKEKGDAMYARLRQLSGQTLSQQETKEKRRLYDESRELYKKAAGEHGFTDHKPVKDIAVFRPTAEIAAAARIRERAAGMSRDRDMTEESVKYIYYDYVGRPARIALVENDIPDACEIFDKNLKKLVRDDSIMLDVMEAYESRMISAAEFEDLLKRSQNLPGQI